MMLIIYSMTC